MNSCERSCSRSFWHLRSRMKPTTILLLIVLCLLVILCCIVHQQNKRIPSCDNDFQPMVKRGDKVRMLRTLQTLIQVLERSGLTYMMYGGTLLGSCRHHGLIPWDDDVDLLLNTSQKERTRRVLQHQSKEYGLYTGTDVVDIIDGNTQWKFYSKQGYSFPNHSYKWPYIDIFFFNENTTHIWDEKPVYRDYFTFSKSQVFPLVRRPYEGLYLFGPCDSYEILSKTYNFYECQSRSFDHRKELDIDPTYQKGVLCRDLEEKFPFVSRHRGERWG